MVAAIGEPFLLSNYENNLGDLPIASRRGVYVTHERSSGSARKAKDGLATVAVHGDGVHVIDVSDLHVVGSFTLGPSTTFACPSVSRMIEENGARSRRIYAAIEQSPGVRSEDAGRTIWMWDDKQTSERAQGKKSSITVSQRVSRIYASEDLPDCVVFLSPGGDVSVMDVDLATQRGEWKSHVNLPLLASYMFPKASATFLHAQPVAPLATLVLLFSSPSVFQVCLLSIHEDRIETVLDESTAVDASVVEASCSASGYISCLQSDGQWRSFQLAVTTPSSLSLLSVSPPLRLAGLTFIGNNSDAAAIQHSSRSVSLLPLGTSLVLLCGGVIQSQELVLLLWDLRYSVVLASQRFSIPARLSKDSIHLELIPALGTLALLSVSSGPLDKPKTFSIVLVVPVTAPATSTIANAMGRASNSAKWLAKPEALSDGLEVNVPLDSDRRGLLDKLKMVTQQDLPEAADSAFFEWLGNRSGSAVAVDSQNVEQGNHLFGHEFVREILDIVLQSKSTSALYPSKIVHHLLENRVVSATMLSQSLLGLLAEKQDWHAIQLAFKNVPNLPEAEVIKLLRSALKDSPPPNTYGGQSEAMGSDTSTLSSVLAACVSYPTSDAALRMAIRGQLNHAEVVLPILVILDDWLVMLSSHGVSLIHDSNATGNDPSAVVPTRLCSGRVEIPPFDEVLGFLRAIFDATFVTLLQSTQSHQLLRRLAAHIQSELSAIDELQSLCGPLGHFARAQEKTVSEKQRPPAQLEDWKRRRKLAHERASMGVGLYQVEELII
ncbi:hypothetical protein F5148DRAFT_1372599 [Russula earlei]|uniref:Uncharacterized protein n=1 Tax=Russula earlei TaxID=71964 RepID=A0ACC0UNQ5_9AGAM|nr:hypothetical protein F5148DRAFT_1372599 [Russula earlei]